MDIYLTSNFEQAINLSLQILVLETISDIYRTAAHAKIATKGRTVIEEETGHVMMGQAVNTMSGLPPLISRHKQDTLGAQP
jgi:hypothetical protein